MTNQPSEVRDFVAAARSYLESLCALAPHRRTGSPGNRAATDFFARSARDWGFQADTAPFPCLDHEAGRVSLSSGGQAFPVEIGPYSPACAVAAPLVAVSTLAELEKSSCRGKILLLRGEICAEPLMPKNFPFYNPDHHRKIYSLIEEKNPAAVVTAPPRNPEMIGAVYPFPLIEDGDFDIPSVFCSDATGDEIASRSGRSFSLSIESRRIPATACNVILRKNPAADRKVVVCDCPGVSAMRTTDAGFAPGTSVETTAAPPLSTPPKYQPLGTMTVTSVVMSPGAPGFVPPVIDGG